MAFSSLAGAVVEVVVAGADDRGRPLGEPGEVLEHHDDLGVERDTATRCRAGRPRRRAGRRRRPAVSTQSSLREVVVEVGHEQDAHAARVVAGVPRPRRPPAALRGAPSLAPARSAHSPVPSDGDLPTPRACASRPRRRATCTSATPGRRCSTGWRRAAPAARCSSASRTPTASASSSELVENILASLRWLGLDWDGDIVFQADNLDVHREAALSLLAKGQAYWCDCTSEQVQARAKERGGPPGYDGFCRDRGLPQSDATALRFRAPDDGTTSFTDMVRGEVSFENKSIEDFVLLRSTGMPMFLLSNAYDDAAMGITHVVRGEDHVPGTPKYLLLRDALDLGRPEVFAHLPMLVNEGRQKLSKRKDAVSVADFAAQGYLPEAMVNYLALLGWGPEGRRRDPPARARSSSSSGSRTSRRRRPSSTSRSSSTSTPTTCGRSTVDEFLDARHALPHPRSRPPSTPSPPSPRWCRSACACSPRSSR